MQTSYLQPPGILAGFHANLPDPNVPEIQHAGEQWAPRRFPIPDHTHTVWEFYLQISGETCWEGPDKTYELMPGGFLAVPPNIPHRLYDQPQDKHHFFFAAVDLDLVLARLPDTDRAWQDNTIVFVPNGETLLAPFRQLVREVALPLSHRTLGMRLAVDTLVLEATRLIDSHLPVADALTRLHPAVRRAKELMDYQPAEPWRLSDLSRVSGLSAHHLVECFTREVGVSPHRYLLGVRVDRAKELLSGSDVSITDLGLELGFSSSQHFAATFKRMTGETAQAYRAAHSQSFPVT